MDIWKILLTGSHSTEFIRNQIAKADAVMMTQFTKSKILNDEELSELFKNTQRFHKEDVKELLNIITISNKQLHDFNKHYKRAKIVITNSIMEYNQGLDNNDELIRNDLKSLDELAVAIATAESLNCRDCKVLTLNLNSFKLPTYRDIICPNILDYTKAVIEDINPTLQEFRDKKYKRLYSPAQIGERNNNSLELNNSIILAKRTMDQNNSIIKRCLYFEKYKDNAGKDTAKGRN